MIVYVLYILDYVPIYKSILIWIYFQLLCTLLWSLFVTEDPLHSRSTASEIAQTSMLFIGLLIATFCINDLKQCTEQIRHFYKCQQKSMEILEFSSSTLITAYCS